MASGSNSFAFNWVSGFSGIPDWVDHSNAIGRFKHNGNSNNAYLWYYCDKSNENLRIQSITTVIDSCDNLDWRFFNLQQANYGLTPQKVYIYDGYRSCDIYTIDGDTSNPSGYGECDITHGKSIEWDMANGNNFRFEYTYAFEEDDLNDENAIARYKDGSNYLWVSCLD